MDKETEAAPIAGAPRETKPASAYFDEILHVFDVNIVLEHSPVEKSYKICSEDVSKHSSMNVYKLYSYTRGLPQRQ